MPKLKNNKIEILGKSIVVSKGITKGLVTNFHEANLVVRECLEISEKQAGISLENIIVNAEFENISSNLLTEYKSVHGDQIEHEKDIQGLIHIAVDEIAKNNKDNAIIHIFSSNYKIDKKINVENPVGFKANIFSADIHAGSSRRLSSSQIYDHYYCQNALLLFLPTCAQEHPGALVPRRENSHHQRSADGHLMRRSYFWG